jgi:hypothetical protein
MGTGLSSGDSNGWGFTSGNGSGPHPGHTTSARRNAGAAYPMSVKQQLSPVGIAAREERDGLYSAAPFGLTAAEVEWALAQRGKGGGQRRRAIRGGHPVDPLPAVWRRRFAAFASGAEGFCRGAVIIAPGFFWGNVALAIIWTAVKHSI